MTAQMTPREERFLAFYEEYRRGAQSKWYRKRYDTYERAHRQSVTLTAFVLFLSSAASILSVRWERPHLWGDLYLAWPVVAAVLAAAGTAVAAYRTLYGFQENARLYRDADNSLAAVLADSPVECRECAEAAIRTPADYLPKVEEVFRREQGQWGQLVAQIKAVTVPEADARGQNRATPPADRNRGGGEGDDEGPDGGSPPPPAPTPTTPVAGGEAEEEEAEQPPTTPVDIDVVPPAGAGGTEDPVAEPPPADTGAEPEPPPADAQPGAGSEGDEEEPPSGGGAPGAVG